MNIDNARRLLATIPHCARVVDVGGGAAPFPRADAVLDAIPYDMAGSGSDGNIHLQLKEKPRFTRDAWIQVDLCEHKPWPVRDKEFDFAICSHLLEDVRDPIWICSELQRVAKAGYIEFPSRVVEQSKGVENPLYAGFYHHRWLITINGSGIQFRHKPHMLHAVRDAAVARLRPWQMINPKYAFLSLDWTNTITAQEVLEFDEMKVIDDLCDFARQARSLPDLVVPKSMPAMDKLKGWIYYRRLARGGY